MVKLSRFKLGCRTTSTELPVLDFACTAHKRLTNEKKIVPRDNIMVVYAGSLVSDPGRVRVFEDGDDDVGV
jgi:hypothetical protein